MKRRIGAILATAGLSLTLVAAAPSAGVSVPSGSVISPLVSVERACAQKGGPASRGSAKKIGDNTAELGSSILVPILFLVIGAFAIYALISRNAGFAIAAIAVGLLAGFFLISPDQAESTFKSMYAAIF